MSHILLLVNHNKVTSDTTNILYKSMAMNKAAGGCYILVITPGVSLVFDCPGPLPVLVSCTCCSFNLTKYSYHFGSSNQVIVGQMQLTHQECVYSRFDLIR